MAVAPRLSWSTRVTLVVLATWALVLFAIIVMRGGA